jgi:alpha-amylase
MRTVPAALFAAGLAAALAACGSGGGGGGGAAPPPAPVYRPTGRAAAGDVFVHLFEWRWADIARECETWLGPRGFKGVQVSPPSEHGVFAASAYPWWQRYQTVSYRLDQSRSGTLAEFADMVGRCRAAGVEIYADAVINHMTAGAGTGSAGSVYTKYAYPDVPWTAADFHAPCSIVSYQDARQVQDCELVGLADLRTENEAVRARIADYLVALHALGVAGFRIDAAKHMPAADLDAILARVNAAATSAGRALPYVFLEVINNPNEAVTAAQYYGVGYASGGASDITEFQYGYRVRDAFLGRNGTALAALQNVHASLLPGDKAVVFTDNHDTQRGDAVHYASTFDSAPIYELAVVYTLAQPHGVVSLMSSYGFDRATQAGRDGGPPGANGVTQSTFDAGGASLCTGVLGTVQAGQWICEHRRAAIAQMVGFRRVAAGAPVSNWTQIGGFPNRIAFARTGLGFVALNRDAVATAAQSVQTTLPAGSYCNVAIDTFTAPGSCSGMAVQVDAAGAALITVPPRGAVALHVNARL